MGRDKLLLKACNSELSFLAIQVLVLTPGVRVQVPPRALIKTSVIVLISEVFYILLTGPSSKAFAEGAHSLVICFSPLKREGISSGKKNPSAFIELLLF